MAVNSKTENADSLFYLDLEGEGFVPAVEEEFADCAINVKNLHNKKKAGTENVVTLNLPCAGHVEPLNTIRRRLTAEEDELYRGTVLKIRKYIYNSIVSEDFCISCDHLNGDELLSEGLSEISDVSSSESIYGTHEPGRVTLPSPSAMTVDCAEDGPRKAPRIDIATYQHKTRQTDKVKHNEPVDTTAIDTSEIQDVVMDNMETSGTTEVAEPRISGLRRKIANDNQSDTQDVKDRDDTTLDIVGNDGIRMVVDMKKLSNTVTDIEHVQMCSSVPFRRLFRLSRENLSAGLVNAGKRYFLAGDSVKTHVEQKCYKSFLAHLYRRKKSVCFFCGFLSCARTENCKQRCDSMRCLQCSFKHKWRKERCKDKGGMVEFYHRTNDWRNRRNNPWHSIPKKVRSHLKCFQCGKPGEANIACRGVSCPRGAETIDYRCLELLGKNNLNAMVRQKPHMFKHLRERFFEFN
ncbi:long-chain fatty acid ligase, putative [Babesia ovis]|uniref:Long-chain fatty acid ligase, putative n=1 Tax=Babesia ovis TaxID=5869 RepID=A0A9W5TCB5_BABOV|nr:long-chain fatty acid ligase, putative [Babesia ovis]